MHDSPTPATGSWHATAAAAGMALAGFVCVSRFGARASLLAVGGLTSCVPLVLWHSRFGRRQQRLLPECAALSATGACLMAAVLRDLLWLQGAALLCWCCGTAFVTIPKALRRLPMYCFGLLAAAVFASAVLGIDGLFLAGLIGFAVTSSLFATAQRDLATPDAPEPPDTPDAARGSAGRAAVAMGLLLILTAILFPLLAAQALDAVPGRLGRDVEANRLSLDNWRRLWLDRTPVMWIKGRAPAYLRAETLMLYREGTWYRGYPAGETDAPPTRNVPPREALEITLDDTRSRCVFTTLDTAAVTCRSANLRRRPDHTFVFRTEPRFPVTYTLQLPVRGRDSLPRSLAATTPDEGALTPCLYLPKSTARLAALARVIAPSNRPERERIARLQAHLLDRCRYRLNPRRRVFAPRGSDDATARFVFDTREGNCRHFASALALMARAVGVPTRIAVGFSGAQYSPAVDRHVVRYANAHAWVEAFIDGRWHTVEASPAITAGGGRLTEWLRARLDAWAFAWAQWRRPKEAGPTRDTHPRQWPALRWWLLATALAVLATTGWTLLRPARHAPGPKTPEPIPDISATPIPKPASSNPYLAMLETVRTRRIVRGRSETPSEFLRRAAAALPAATAQLQRITEWFCRYRYGDCAAAERERPHAQEALALLRQALESPESAAHAVPPESRQS